jgi:hypothetical protein
MSRKKRFFLTIIFLVVSLSLLSLSESAVIAYKKYKFFGRVPPTYTKSDVIDDKEEIKKFFLKKEFITELYQLVKDIDELLTKHKIRYFVDGGTLLGTIRNNGPILYDDDADISIFAEDAKKFLALEEEINKLGYKLIIKYPEWYVVTSKRVALDVFQIKKIGSIYRFANDSARLSWSRFFLYEDEVFPLRKHRFGGIEVSIPQDPETYLKRGYGLDCISHAVFSGNHRFGHIGRSLKVLVSDVQELREPAEYLEKSKKTD